MLHFRHQTVFGLCLTVFILTAAVVASVALMLFERQDVAALQDRIAVLSRENVVLKHQLQTTARVVPAGQCDETISASAVAGDITGYGKPGR